VKHYNEEKLWKRLAKKDNEIKGALEKGWDPPPISCLWEMLMETLGSSPDYMFNLLIEFEGKYNTNKKQLQRLRYTDLIHDAIENWKVSLESAEEEPLDCERCDDREKCPLRDKKEEFRKWLDDKNKEEVK